MRFMAILGFCLMAVFALIQAIPVSQDNGGVGVQHNDLLEQELSQARAQLDKLQARLESAQAAERLSQSKNQELQAKLTSVEASLLKQARAMRKLSTELNAQNSTLGEAEQAMRRLRRNLHRAERELQKIQQANAVKTPAIEHQPKPTPVKAPTPPLTPPVRTTAQPEPLKATEVDTPRKTTAPALSMRFASTAAINRLIAAGRTQLIGVVGNRAWRSEPNGQFVASATPARTYELTEDPGELLVKRFRRGSGLLNANTVRWLVTFDPYVLGQINQHLAQQADGALVIQANGKVNLEIPGSTP